MRKLSYGDYLDKVRGGWFGKCLGGTIGCFEGTKRITDLDIMDLLPDQMIANDDLDIQLVWLDVLLNKGIHFTSEQLMQAWIQEYPCNFGEYAAGRRNYLRGLVPPESGRYSNFFYRNSMGCPIRSEVWGMIAPGCPDAAAEYAYRDGILDHDGESVWAEQFLSAMEAEAFFERDMDKLIETGLRYVPKESQLFECIDIARKGYTAGKKWQEVWAELRDGYGHPDCTHVPQNLGITVMALLYGERDLDKTLTITANAGWDVDCTCSTTAALLGILMGYRAFPDKWISYIGDQIVTLAVPVNPMNSVALIAEYTCRAGVTLQREGVITPVVEKIPADLAYLPAAEYTGAASLTVDYQGEPAIAVGVEKEILLRVQNHTGHIISGVLRLEKIPQGFLANQSSVRLAVEPGKTAGCVVRLTLSSDLKVLPDKNMFRAVFSGDDGILSNCEFGLCGAPACRVSPLYYDTYMDWLKAEDMPPHRLLRSKGTTVIIPEAPEEWGNHRIDIDKEYGSEDFHDREKTAELFQDGKRAAIYGDQYVLKDVYGFDGPACVYYYQELHSPKKREACLFLGSSDPFKLWINGELALEQKECRFWYPNHYAVPVNLREGCNQIVLKIARVGENNRLSMAFREKQTIAGFDSAPYLTDLSYSTFQGGKS